MCETYELSKRKMNFPGVPTASSMWAPQRQVGFLRIWLYRQEEIGRMVCKWSSLIPIH